MCPPSLHISLGLWDKFVKLLVRDIQDLGEKIADDLAAAEHVNIIDYNNFAIATNDRFKYLTIKK